VRVRGIMFRFMLQLLRLLMAANGWGWEVGSSEQYCRVGAYSSTLLPAASNFLEGFRPAGGSMLSWGYFGGWDYFVCGLFQHPCC